MVDKAFGKLIQFIGSYSGEGINHEGQSFTGKFSLKPLLEGRGFSIQFTATGKNGTIYHQEESTIASSFDEKLTLWNLNTNLPCMTAHELRQSGPKDDTQLSLIFGFNQPNETKKFREEIALDVWNNGDVSYSYAWGMPNGEFKERSSVRMVRSKQ